MARMIGTGIFVTSLLLSSLPVRADAPMTLEAKLGQAVMKEGSSQHNFLRVAIGGCVREKTNRTPVNVAFVIDRSGSMQGMRIVQAREAAIMALRRLNDADIASVVIFDDSIDVLVPARPVADKDHFIDRIRQVGTRGKTAIFGGVTEGAREVRRFKDRRRLNRVVLLSDGRANVGPSRPDDFEQLGRALLADGISVSTIGLGLGYNEDLMLKLARASDGNHAFAADAAALIPIFNREFDDVLASCAQMVSVDVELKPGVKVVRALSRDGTVDGQHAHFTLNQIYQATEHYLLLEVEIDKTIARGEQELGHIRVAYTSPEDGTQRELKTGISGRFSASEAVVAESRDNTVFAAVVEQTTRERALKAIALRDKGKFKEAQDLLRQNVADIKQYTAVAGSSSPRLEQLSKEYDTISSTTAAAAPAAWGRQRKMLQQLQASPAGSGVRY